MRARARTHTLTHTQIDRVVTLGFRRETVKRQQKPRLKRKSPAHREARDKDPGKLILSETLGTRQVTSLITFLPLFLLLLSLSLSWLWFSLLSSMVVVLVVHIIGHT